MKAQQLFFWIILFIGLAGFSQKRNRGTFEVIPNIGFAGSNLMGSDLVYSDTRFAFQTGVNLDYYFNDRWSLRTGLSYFSMGAQSFFDQLELNYLNIPINANWHFGSTRKWNLNFGITPGYLLNASSQDEDLEELFTSFQLAFSFGIGYKLEITKSFSLLIDYQRLFGLTNIVKETELSGIRNNADSINLGAVFAF